ncbi:MAG: class I tRNA ligase family protein, partial [Synergistaceae bacterium]|nr:class I tRNA ligase family protein [Synergistaceae bacterium]
ALRLTLSALTLQGRDIFLSESRIEQYRFFLNKLWNASRFALMNLEDAPVDLALTIFPDGVCLKVWDRWILARLSDVVEEMTTLLDGYFFGESTHVMYDFVWGELCDWYLELSKPALRGDEGESRKLVTQYILYTVFRDVLKLLHPIIPFVTEELWSAFGYGDKIIGRSSWPKPRTIPNAEGYKGDMNYLQTIIRAMRNLRAEIKMPPQQTAPLMSLRLKDERRTSLVSENLDMLTLMARVEKIDLKTYGEPKPPKSLSYLTGEWDLFMPVGDLLDVDREIARLENEFEKLETEMRRIMSKLENKHFIERAPAEVVEKDRSTLADCESRKRRIEENIAGLALN